MKQNIIVKGTSQKNKLALIFIIFGAVLLIAWLLVASYVFNNCYCNSYKYWYYHWCSYYGSFGDFLIGEFFNLECIYGYMILLGIIAIIVGVTMKFNTEKCEITVTDEAVSGKLPHGKSVNIPLNQITAINRSSFNGISITSIGNSSNFYCIANREEVMKAISYLLVSPYRGSSQSATVNTASVDADAERLTMLKELFDASALTQEEFDAKKKQILGL